MQFTPGVVQSLPDSRDYIYSHLVTAEELPSAFSLPDIPVRDQGKFGTCVGFAAAGVKDYQEAKNYPSRGISTSPLFIYSECKKIDGIPNTPGTYPRTAMAVLKDKGICKEKTFSYSKMAGIVPSAPSEAHTEAQQFRIGAYAKVSTITEIKQAIYRDGAVLAGVLVFDNFLLPEAGRYIDVASGGMLGGHGIAIPGWDDNMTFTYKNGKTRKGFFKIRNSWSESWGDKGYAWLPYDFVLFRDLDLGMPCFLEAWSSVDIILPPEAAKEVILWVGSNRALVDGEEVLLDQAPTIDSRSNRTLVPLRFLSEVLNYNVAWNAAEGKITLKKPGVIV